MEDIIINQNEHNIIFTMSRMNPPTPGHLFLVQKLIEEGVKQNTNKVYVILSKTNDNNEDPIACENKINVLNLMTNYLKEQMVNDTVNSDTVDKILNIDVNYICVKPEQKSPFSPLYDIINEYPETDMLNLFMIIGDDRKDLLDSVADTFLFKNERIKSFDGIVLDRPSMSEYKNMTKSQLQNIDINNVPVGAFSASFIRNIVKYNLKDKFDDIYGKYLDNDKIDILYNQIKEGLLLGNKKSKSSSKTPIQKYLYPLIKGTENYEIILKSKGTKRKRDDISGGKRTNKLRNKLNKLNKSKNKKLKKKLNKSKKNNKKIPKIPNNFYFYKCK